MFKRMLMFLGLLVIHQTAMSDAITGNPNLTCNVMTSGYCSDITVINSSSSSANLSNIRAAKDFLMAHPTTTVPLTLNLQANQVYKVTTTSLDPSGDHILTIDNSTRNFTFNGNNAELSLGFNVVVLHATKTSNVTFKNLKIDYYEPNFTQGTVQSYDANTQVLYLKLDSNFVNYPPVGNGFYASSGLPITKVLPATTVLTGGTGNPTTNEWANSSAYQVVGTANPVFEKKELFINRVAATTDPTVFRLQISINDNAEAVTLVPSGTTTHKLVMRRHGGTLNAQMFEMTECGNMVYDSIDVYNTMKMGFTGIGNTGQIVHNKIRIIPRPNTNRLGSGLAGAFFYVHGGRGPIILTNSTDIGSFDDTLDMSINYDLAHYQDDNGKMLLGTNAIHTSNSSTVFLRDLSQLDLRLWKRETVPVKENDIFALMNAGNAGSSLVPTNDVLLGYVKATNVSKTTLAAHEGRVYKTTLVPTNGTTNLPSYQIADSSIGLGIDVFSFWGLYNNSNRHPCTVTRFINLTNSFPGSIIANNVVKNKPRNAFMIRTGYQMRLTGNVVDNIIGSSLTGETPTDAGEGGYSYLSDFSGNKFTNTSAANFIFKLSVPTVTTYKPDGTIDKPACSTTTRTNYLPSYSYVNNNWLSSNNVAFVALFKGPHYLGNNQYNTATGNQIPGPNEYVKPYVKKPMLTTTVNGVTNTFFVTPSTSCRVVNSTLSTLWGPNADKLTSAVPTEIINEYAKFKTITGINVLPPGRTYVGVCPADSRIYKDSANVVYRKEPNVPLCKFNSDQNMQVSTGLLPADKAYLPVGPADTAAPNCTL